MPAKLNQMESPFYRLRLHRGAKVVGLSGALFLHAIVVGAQNPPESEANAGNGVVPPEAVRVEKQSADGDTRYAIVGNDKGHYWLICKSNSKGCISLDRSRNYLLFNSRTRWKLPGANQYLTLPLIQD